MKKGFTLIELMAVIALLAVIVTLTSISVTSFRKRSYKSLCEQKEKYIIASAIKYGQDHLNELTDTNDSHWGQNQVNQEIKEKCPYGYVISINDLIIAGYITADSENKSRLLIPGKPDTYDDSFNPKTVCIKYENIYDGTGIENASYIDENGSTHSYTEASTYHSYTNYQVTAKMNWPQCNN